MDSMIEYVARALCVADGKKPDADWRMSKVPNGSGYIMADVVDDHPESWRHYTKQARAALSAMREPTETMVERGRLQTAGDFDDGRSMAIACWEEMIDSALKEGE